MTVLQGKAFKFGDNISTDHIAPGRLYHLRSDLNEFAKHVLEDADENFAIAYVGFNPTSSNLPMGKVESVSGQKV